MSNELYDALAKSALNPEKRRKTRDSEWFSPDTQGSMVIHEFSDISKDMKRQAIIVGEIIESHPRVAGALAQAPGTLVKKLYPLSTFAWAIDKMMNDICDITGVDPATMTADDLKGLFHNVFEGKALRGVVVNFKTQLETVNKKTKQKREQPLTSVYFIEPKGPVDADGAPVGEHINAPEKIAARAAKLPAQSE